MHLEGTHMKITVKRANGTSEVLHDKPFDFAYERLYQTDLITDEMCYVFTMAYPKGALVAPDLWGGFAHGGTSCFGQ
jgi:hypothetical protein